MATGTDVEPYQLTGITKLQAAHRQLNAAIRMHFEGGDPLAVHTLAGAASTIISDLASHRGSLSWDEMAIGANRITPGEYYAVMRKAQNFLKHADRDPDGTTEINVQETEDIMFAATLTAGWLEGISTSEQVFQLWYIAMRAETFAENFEPLKAAEQLFPGIRDQPVSEQRRQGLTELYREHEYQRSQQT